MVQPGHQRQVRRILVEIGNLISCYRQLVLVNSRALRPVSTILLPFFSWNPDDRHFKFTAFSWHAIASQGRSIQGYPHLSVVPIASIQPPSRSQSVLGQNVSGSRPRRHELCIMAPKLCIINDGANHRGAHTLIRPLKLNDIVASRTWHVAYPARGHLG